MGIQAEATKAVVYAALMLVAASYLRQEPTFPEVAHPGPLLSALRSVQDGGRWLGVLSPAYRTDTSSVNGKGRRFTPI